MPIFDEKCCVCFPCLENLGESAKVFVADDGIRDLIKRKRKSMGLYCNVQKEIHIH